VSDAEAVDAFHRLAETEGILPALESAHALAEAIRHAPKLPRSFVVLVCLSGRGDKDLESVAAFDVERRARSRRGVLGPLPHGYGGDQLEAE